MLFQIICLYIYDMLWFCGCGCGVIQVKASKYTKNYMIKGSESQEEFQTTLMDKADAILT